MLKTKDLYDLTHTRAASILEECEYPWQALGKIKEFIIELGKTLPADEFDEVSENVWIAKDAKIYPNNYIGAPAIIGHETEVRPGAFIRGSALVGDHCVVGNSTELKNVILFDNVQVDIGPATDEGFYYDFDLEHRLSPEDFPKIEAEVARLIALDEPFVQRDVSVEEAKQMLGW